MDDLSDDFELKPIININQSIIDFINKLPIFDSLTSDEIQILIKYTYFTKCNPGRILFKEGDKGEHICFVANGVLDVLKLSETGHHVAIATLHKGRSIGEMSVVDDFPRSATVRTRTKVTLLMISKKDFDLILNNHPQIGIKILKGISRLLSQNLRKTSSRLVDYMLPLG